MNYDLVEFLKDNAQYFYGNSLNAQLDIKLIYD